MITNLGPTATGKTSFAAYLAYHLNGEIISADSRQVYRGMDLGTGKDYDDYIVNCKEIKYHLIDIVEPGYEYNVHEFQKDFLLAYNKITGDGHTAFMCGGTGLYINSILKRYNLTDVPENSQLRSELALKTYEDLITILKSHGPLHNVTDTKHRERLIRAIEIQEHCKQNDEKHLVFPEINNVTFGISYDRKIIRERITSRLNHRLNNGMIEEVENLLNKGLQAEQLMFYGLEYKFITQYIIGQISYNDLFRLLNTAIHQFAKRQMTWFRKMEKDGLKIHWIDGNLDIEEKKDIVVNLTKSEGLII